MSNALEAVSMTVTADAIRAYAELTNDFNPIHLDADFAAKTPMGGVIAHGTMSISLVWMSIEKTFGGAALAGADLDDIRFVKPVRIGERLTAGGQRSEAVPDSWDIWVRAADGADRLSGTVRLVAQRPAGQGMMR